jgi:uncharacterized membrane protein/energy-coupling factor transporter transmembrane protein EcfT
MKTLNIIEERQIKKIALLVSCAAVLQIAESLIPHPIPGVRLGLANMITLVALVNLGFRVAVEIAVLRTVVSSLILGTFLSPTFILSLSGALVSTLVMGLFYRVSTAERGLPFSLIGISLIGAITHNLVQVGLVYLLLIQHSGIFLLLPWLGISAVIMGWINGLVASQVCIKLEQSSDLNHPEPIDTDSIPSFKPMNYIPQDSPIHRLSPETKIITVFIFALIILIFNYVPAYLFFLLLLLGVIFLSRISFLAIFSGIKKLSIFLIFSFFIPVFFNTAGEVVFQLGPLRITQEGLYMGSMFVFRIFLLIVGASLLMRTTSPEDMTSGLRRILSPLKVFGISGQRIATIIMLSWTSMPNLWKRIRYAIQSRKYQEKRLRSLIPALSDLIASVFNQIDEDLSEEKI